MDTFIAFNINAINTLIMVIMDNWVIIFSLIPISFMVYFELQLKNEEHIEDRRKIY